jgi:2-polyprenyl-3-methyl-5-hydroxy-6-metoxy-1,4-benzoquinol methylase
MKDIFDTYVENTFGDHKQADFKIKQFEINYRPFFPKEKRAQLLDIGIGRGEMLTCMKEWGYANYLGVDISPSTVKFCKQLGLNCVLTNDTFEWLADKDSTYDVITLLDVLEHFKKEDVIPFLRCLYKAIKPDGKIIIQVPNLQAPDSQLHRYNDFTHQIGFIENSLRQVLIASGISNISFQGFEEIITNTYKAKIKFIIRMLYWKYCRLVRRINTNLNPEILNPVFFVVCTKA